MKRLFWIIILIAILVAGWFIYTVAKPKTTPETVKKQSTKALPKEFAVILDKKGFSPKEVTVKVGDAVRWKNTSGADQTVNSDDYPTNQRFKELNFGVFANGSSVVYIFKKPGIYTYHNQFKPKQRGEIIVK